jgi:AcrR family transcriptional regulator
MAKSGAPSRVQAVGAGRSEGTKQLLVTAAIDTLKIDGFGGASARAIAGRAGCNQALVFYHFGSVVSLLLAALDAVSEERLERYTAALQSVRSTSQLVDAAGAIFREDLASGNATVLVEMIAGASSTPGLGAEVAARIAPWSEFARRAVEATMADSPLRTLVPGDQAAYGIVALYLGLELLTHLDGDPAPALALFDRVKQLSRLLDALGGPLSARPNKEAP